MGYAQKPFIANVILLMCCMAGGQSALTLAAESSTQQVDMKMNTMPETINANKMPRTLFVGTYGDEHQPGGIYSLRLSSDGKKIEQLNHLANPKLAGYLMYD
ncbi:lactonase family protein, partial [Salmonella enterica subsp. enterica serovar Kentucky]|nr:lactonase family protein [Salmonella enterica subsp. enterica serovar Kentucky]